MANSLSRVVAVSAIALAATACQVGGEDAVGGTAEAFTTAVDHYLDQADLAPEVRAILVDARETGEVTYEQYHEAALLWIDCATELGFKAQLIETFNEGQIRFATGLEYPDGITSEEDPGYESYTAAAEQCRDSFFRPVEWLYVTQPKALDLRVQYFERFREPTWTCLHRLGSSLNKDASVDEYQDESNLIAESTGTDCLYDAGYYDTGNPVAFDLP